MADAENQIVQAAAHGFGVARYLKTAEADNQPGEGADDADTGQDAWQVLVEAGFERRVDQRLLGEELAGHRRRPPLRWLAGFVVAVQRLGKLSP